MNLKKSSFHIKKVEFLDHIISGYGIEMSSSKVEEVKNWETPWKVEDLQEFLGFINFYRHIIRDFAKLAVPSTTINRKN